MLHSLNLANVNIHIYTVYSWGTIEMKGTPIYTQNKPQLQDSKNIVNFSCGSSHTVAVDSHSYAFSLGSNDQFQLGIPSQKLCKSFKKIDNNMIGDIKKVFCINDCTFLVNTDMEVFFCGKYSLKSKILYNHRISSIKIQASRIWRLIQRYYINYRLNWNLLYDKLTRQLL